MSNHAMVILRPKAPFFCAMNMKSDQPNYWVRIWVIGIVLLASLSVFFVYKLVLAWPKERLEQKLEKAITQETTWFLNNQKETGDFVYEQVAATGEVNDANSIVRQAGASYGLGQAYGYKKDPQVMRAFEKNLTYFRSLSATKSATQAMISHEGATYSNTTALVVLGLTEYIEADSRNNTTENLEYLVRLSNYLESTQATSGAYIYSYEPTPTESDYNNGETMYALIRSYRLTQKDSYLTSVKRMADYAISHYGTKKFNSSFFSWGMAGFAYLYDVSPDERYWKFLLESAKTYMSMRGKYYDAYIQKNEGDPVPPAAAVFLEGIAHVGWIAKEKDLKVYTELHQHVRSVLDYLLVYVLGGPYGRYKSESASASGAMCATVQCETTRVDFMQHHMSAMTLYLKFMNK